MRCSYYSTRSHSNGVYVALFVVDLLEEFFFEELGWDSLSVLLNCLLKLTVDLHLCECDIFIGAMSNVEDASIILAGITLPH